MVTLLKSVRGEFEDLQLAHEMIRLGARLQPIRELTALSYDRISTLYREIVGISPPKGMLPYSLDWYVTWKPNIHASLFYWIYRRVEQSAQQKPDRKPSHYQKAWFIIDAYHLYRQNVAAVSARNDPQDEAELSFTRAWILLRYIDSKQIKTAECQKCHGHFLIRGDEHGQNHTCGICKPPPRAGISLVK